MKRKLLFRNAVILFTVLMALNLSAQIKEVSIRANADATLLKELPNFNAGADYSNQLCNFDSVGPYGGTDSPEESWIRWDLSDLQSQIGEGEEILYAEVELLITWNSNDPNIAQGFRALHMDDSFDYWVEGNGVSDGTVIDNLNGITWNSAKQIGDFEDASNLDTVFVKMRAGVVPDFEKFDITDAVKNEIDGSRDNILTLRMVPSFNSLSDRKKWLGFITLQSNNAPGWGGNLPLDDEGYPLYSPHIKVYIGKPVNRFSNYGTMGDIRNYNLKPDQFGYWMVAEDEGSDRMEIMKKTTVDTNNWVPGAVAVYNDSVYSDFEMSVKAKMNYTTPSGAFFPFNDFIMVFGYQDAANFSYFAFYGDNESGVYQVSNGLRELIGETSTKPAMMDTAYHTYKLTRTGSEINAYIDGEYYFTVTNDVLNAAGKIGLGSHNDVVFFDDFTDGRAPSGISQKQAFNVTLYPNPASDIVKVNAEKNLNSVSIIDLTGQNVLSVSDINSKSVTLNLSQLPKGLYLIVTKDMNNRIRTDKLIRQ